MALPAPAPRFTAEDYLVWEAGQSEKHEFVAGEVFAMGGASRTHVTVALNIAGALADKLEGSPCRTFMSDMKLQVQAATAYFYPDVMVTCNEVDRRADQFVTAPILIIEVLSDASAGYDRGDKFAAYRRLPSLEQYVLVDPEQRRVESYTRTAERQWLLQDVAPETPLVIPGLEFSLPWARVFRNLD
ncbi:MAG: Uma2 family endonuclease [Actinomycetota bacterium]